MARGSWRPNRTAIYGPPTLMAVSVVSFSFSRAAQPEAQGPSSRLDDGFLYCILSPNGPPKLHRGSWGPLRPGGGFPYHISSLTPSDVQLSDFLSWPSYIIVQRPLNRPLNLWIGMFDRHQAEITVMQFRGHSLPVDQSMIVSWAFTLSHFISQIHPHDLFRLLAIGMCHFLPMHHFGMACLAGSKVKIQHTYIHIYIYIYMLQHRIQSHLILTTLKSKQTKRWNEISKNRMKLN